MKSGFHEVVLVRHGETDIGLTEIGELQANTATVSTLGYERDTQVIRRWNEGCHLRGVDFDT